MVCVVDVACAAFGKKRGVESAKSVEWSCANGYDWSDVMVQVQFTKNP
jgi:hypothetical protein